MYQIPQRRRLTKDSKWVTISDLKIQAIKEICYEVALNDFRQSRQEIEALAIVKMKELCATYNKKDPNERDSWRAVARDVWDTVGVGDERIEDVISTGRGVTDMDDLKVHIDKLEDILHEVKKQNNMKDEEIKTLRNKMLKMEKVLPLISADSQDKSNVRAVLRARSASESKPLPEDKPERKHTEDQVSRQTNDDDFLFGNGHMRWMQNEQTRLKNLQQQEISSQLRRQRGPHRFIPPEDRKLRFPFRSNPKHRNSWSPGTHIIITDEQVIEMKVPKDSVQEEDTTEPDFDQNPPSIHDGSFPPLPNTLSQPGKKEPEQVPNHRHNHGYRNQHPHERGRSNSFNPSQQSFGSMESLHSRDRKHQQPPQQVFLPPRYNQNQTQPNLFLPPHHQQLQQSWYYNTGGSYRPHQQYIHHHQYQHQPSRDNTFQTPPRMLRQFSAPNLKAGQETSV